MPVSPTHLLADCTTDLFRSYSVQVQRSATSVAPADGRDPVLTGAIVELHVESAGSRPNPPGKVLLLASFDFIASTRPAGGGAKVLSTRSAGDWIYVRDWTRELTNQLAGRVTNGLAANGATVSTAPPRALDGETTAREINAKGAVALQFVAGSHTLYAALALPAVDGSSKRAAAAVAAPGTVTFFGEGPDE